MAYGAPFAKLQAITQDATIRALAAREYRAPDEPARIRGPRLPPSLALTKASWPDVLWATFTRALAPIVPHLHGEKGPSLVSAVRDGLDSGIERAWERREAFDECSMGEWRKRIDADLSWAPDSTLLFGSIERHCAKVLTPTLHMLANATPGFLSESCFRQWFGEDAPAAKAPPKYRNAAAVLFEAPVIVTHWSMGDRGAAHVLAAADALVRSPPLAGAANDGVVTLTGEASGHPVAYLRGVMVAASGPEITAIDWLVTPSTGQAGDGLACGRLASSVFPVPAVIGDSHLGRLAVGCARLATTTTRFGKRRPWESLMIPGPGLDQGIADEGLVAR